ncbi:hypothetical protein Bbelb_049240 [Branchiostoma belcheri]|nr:hypothetical protein Bbelb_049240 [Branchiostoma belcheri]
MDEMVVVKGVTEDGDTTPWSGCVINTEPLKLRWYDMHDNIYLYRLYRYRYSMGSLQDTQACNRCYEHQRTQSKKEEEGEHDKCKMDEMVVVKGVTEDGDPPPWSGCVINTEPLKLREGEYEITASRSIGKIFSLHKELVDVDIEGESVPTASYLQEMEDIGAQFERMPNDEWLGKV